MKRMIGLLVAMLLTAEFAYPPLVSSQLYVPLEHEIDPLPIPGPAPLPKPKNPPIPIPFLFDLGDLKDIRRYPFPVPSINGFALYACEPYCNQDFCLLCTTHIPQLIAGWCWNATAQIIMDYKGVRKSQCDIAQEVYFPIGSPPCCTAAGVPNTSTNCGILAGDLPEFAFDAYDFGYFPPSNSTNYELLQWYGVNFEISHDRPYSVLLRIWLRDPNTNNIVDSDLHTVVADGYRTTGVDPREVHIYDPQEDDDWWESYDVFYSNNDLYEHVGDTFRITQP